MQKNLIVGGVVVVIVAGAIAAVSMNRTAGNASVKEDAAMMAKDQTMEGSETDSMSDGMMEKDQMEGKEVMMDKDNGMMKDDSMEGDDAMMKGDEMSGEGMMAKPGSYVAYSADAAKAAATDGKAVVFFHAAWCPTCKAAEAAFTSRAAEIPAGVTILKADYDTESALKAKYGITYQHTFVQVDAQGNQLAKWNGGAIEELAANLK
jgi:thiol-disulfide isomerase/thioredoxin